MAALYSDKLYSDKISLSNISDCRNSIYKLLSCIEKTYKFKDDGLHKCDTAISTLYHCFTSISKKLSSENIISLSDRITVMYYNTYVDLGGLEGGNVSITLYKDDGQTVAIIHIFPKDIIDSDIDQYILTHKFQCTWLWSGVLTVQNLGFDKIYSVLEDKVKNILGYDLPLENADLTLTELCAVICASWTK